VEAARRHAGELTILAIAPHTNLAAALAEEPRLGTLVKELVLMGGCAKDGTRQFNFSADPAATRAVLEMGCPTVMLTNELCLSVAMTPADVRRLAVDGSLIRLFVPRLKRFARFQSLYRGRNGGDPGEALGGFHPWDVVAAAWLVAPELFREVEELRPTVEDAGHVRVEGGAAVVRAPRSLDVPRFLDLMVSRLTAVRAG
jgi:purine nucleosidase